MESEKKTIDKATDRLSRTRNFVIIAHIDHGKSTLADRMLEITGTVEKRKMKEQILDKMELEREKGITIKMAPVRMFRAINSESYILNLIDTPGHVDFAYEVSRALAAVEGAVLLVDATQGVQAQTVANLEAARKENLAIIPAVNKIDAPGARVGAAKEELSNLLGVSAEEILAVSGKTGEGVEKILEAVVEKIPPPHRSENDLLKAVIFDSHFDSYKGIVAHVRVLSGALKAQERLFFMAGDLKTEAIEVGVFKPELVSAAALEAGNIGYVATGLKEAEKVRVGDTIIHWEDKEKSIKPFPGYREPQPMVFAGFFPEEGDDFEILRDALSKLKLNDASLTFEPDSSEALGRGFRCGFLGLLHLDIIRERLKREYGIGLTITTPSVAYKINLKNGQTLLSYSAADFPDASKIAFIEEPWVALEIIAPPEHLGNIMQVLNATRGIYKETASLSAERLIVKHEAPLSEIIVDFYDMIKSASRGYASMGYQFLDYRRGDLVKLNILIAAESAEALAAIVPRAEAYHKAQELVRRLKELIPPENFAVAVQGTIDGKIIARETIPALKKDVTGYLYGGDRSRKMKLWSKQKKGKKRLKERGRVTVPSDVYRKIFQKSYEQ